MVAKLSCFLSRVDLFTCLEMYKPLNLHVVDDALLETTSQKQTSCKTSIYSHKQQDDVDDDDDDDEYSSSTDDVADNSYDFVDEDDVIVVSVIYCNLLQLSKVK